MVELKSQRGKFYIGDPCYALSDEDYEIWGEKFNFRSGVCKINGIDFAVYETEFGDGEFEGSDGFSYSVDSGTIAAIPIELVGKNFESLGKIVNANELKLDYFLGEFKICNGDECIMIQTNYS